MLFFTDIIWIAALSAAIGAGIAALIFGLKFKKGGSSGSEKGSIVNGIRDNALAFSKMYEPVYSVSAGKNAKQEEIFAAWNAAVDTCEDEAFKKAFAEKFGDYARWGVSKKGKVNAKKVNKTYIKKARALVKCFFKVGIIRESDVYVVADETTAEKYEIVGGAIEAGTTYDVLAPYWHLSNDIVDKGVIR